MLRKIAQGKFAEKPLPSIHSQLRNLFFLGGFEKSTLIPRSIAFIICHKRIQQKLFFRKSKNLYRPIYSHLLFVSGTGLASFRPIYKTLIKCDMQMNSCLCVIA